MIALSKLPIINWVATKEYNEQNRPYLHMYVELERDALLNTAMSTNILKDLLSTYFKYIDQDYRDLKKDSWNGSSAGDDLYLWDI